MLTTVSEQTWHWSSPDAWPGVPPKAAWYGSQRARRGGRVRHRCSWRTHAGDEYTDGRVLPGGTTWRVGSDCVCLPFCVKRHKKHATQINFDRVPSFVTTELASHSPIYVPRLVRPPAHFEAEICVGWWEKCDPHQTHKLVPQAIAQCHIGVGIWALDDCLMDPAWAMRADGSKNIQFWLLWRRTIFSWCKTSGKIFGTPAVTYSITVSNPALGLSSSWCAGIFTLILKVILTRNPTQVLMTDRQRQGG